MTEDYAAESRRNLVWAIWLMVAGAVLTGSAAYNEYHPLYSPIFGILGPGFILYSVYLAALSNKKS